MPLYDKIKETSVLLLSLWKNSEKISPPTLAWPHLWSTVMHIQKIQIFPKNFALVNWFFGWTWVDLSNVRIMLFWQGVKWRSVKFWIFLVCLFVCLFIYLVLKHSYQGLVKDLDGDENIIINIAKTWMGISRQNWEGFFLDISHQMLM